MPIRIPDALPATDLLAAENIFVMTEYRAMHQDIRPLRVVLLNLMPTKIATETQILRRLSNTPLQVEITLLRMASHDAKNVSEQHLETFYRTFGDIAHEHFDGMIITGAPVELLDFEEVDYWPELCRIMEWSSTHVHSTLHICWGAQAGIYFHYGVQKHELPAKMTGVFEHRQIQSKLTSPLLRGFDDLFWAPHSRYTEVRAEDIEAHPELELLAVSDEAGVYAAKSVDSRRFFVFGHPEYDRATLNAEYERDTGRMDDAPKPQHYYPDDDPSQAPRSNWRAHAQLLYTNWLNYYVYQTTPYDVRLAGKESGDAPAGAQESAPTGDGDKPYDARPAGKEGCDGPKNAQENAPTGDGVKPHDVRLASKGSGDGPEGAQENAPLKAVKREAKPSAAESKYVEREDDDGYDPWSDRREETPFFEPDPWR